MLGINFRFGGCLFLTFSSQLKYLEDNGYEKARNLQQKPNRLLATILISNNFVNVAIVVLSTYLVNSLFDFSAYPTLGFIIQVIVVTFVILLAGEIIPKLYANRSQLSMVIFMAGPLTFLSHLLRPLSALLIGSTSIINSAWIKRQFIHRPIIQSLGINQGHGYQRGKRHFGRHCPFLVILTQLTSFVPAST